MARAHYCLLNQAWISAGLSTASDGCIEESLHVVWLCGGGKRPPPPPPLPAHVTAPGNQCQPRWASASDNETKLWWTCVTERGSARRNREYALCIYVTEYFPHVSESQVIERSLASFQSILFVLKLPYVCLLPYHISLSHISLSPVLLHLAGDGLCKFIFSIPCTRRGVWCF